MEYKCDWYGKNLVFADRFFPSSKKCSRCGNIKHDLKLSDRVYHCSCCELVIDRDLNASINLANYIKDKNTSRYEGINASGDERFISGSLDSGRCSSVKLESNIRFAG